MQYNKVLALSRLPYFMLAVLSITHQSAMQTQLTEVCWSGDEFGDSQVTGILYCLNGLVPKVLPLNITSLFIGGNTITSIEANAFEDSSFTALQKLTIRRTGIQDFPDHVFSSLHNLIEVHLVSNPITTIKQHWLSSMTVLHQLVICQTQIRAIESTTFPPLESMRRLNLSGNQIQIIGRESFRNLQGLEELDLSSNQLMTLGADGIDGLELKLLDVSRNPWTCECELTDFVQWLRTFTSENGNKTLSNSLITACAKPLNVAGLALWNLSDMCLTSTLSNAYVITRHTTAADSQGTLAGITVGSMLLFFVLCFLCLCLLLLIVSRKRKVVQPKENDLECGVADNCNQTQANPNQSNVSVFKKVQKTTEQLQTGSCEKMDAMIMNISTISETRKDECKHHINKEVSQNKLFMYPEENHHIQRFSLEPESDNKIILSQDLDEAGERESGAKTGRKSRRHPDEQTEQKESNKDSMAEHPPIRMNKLCFIQRLPTYYNDSCKDPTSAKTPVYGTLASHSSMDDKHDLKLSAQVLQEHRDSDLTAANGKGKSCMLADKENLFDSITSFPNDKSGESDEARPGEPDQNEIRLSATTFKTEKLTSTEEKTGEGDGNGISDHSALSLQDCDGSPRPALSTSGVNLPDSKADTQHEQLTHEKMPEAHAVRTESDSKGESGACYQAGTEPGIAFNEPYNVDTNSAAADNMAMINRCGFRGQRQEYPLNKEELGLYNCSLSEKQSIRSMDSCENMINCFTSDAEVTDSHTYSVESLCFPETPQQCKEDIGPKHVMTTIQNKIRRKRALSEDPLSPINNKVGTQISYVASAMKHSFPGNENQTDKLNRSFFLKRRTSSLPPAQFSTGKARRKTVTFSSVSDLGRYKKDCSAPAPRDVDLLNDNQYLEMNLLYEVAENKGRRRRGKSCPGPSLPCEKVL